MSDDPPPICGLYGKLPTLGDFVLRRLPKSFVAPWDDWLRRSISESQGELAEGWTEAFLTSPPWRFALDPGVAGPDGWLGVFASSIDSVRRSYPITLAVQLPAGFRLADLHGDVEVLAKALEAMALLLIDGTLAPDAALERLEKGARGWATAVAKERLSMSSASARVQLGPSHRSLASITAHFRSLSETAALARPSISAFWHERWHETPAANFNSIGLPEPGIFARFLDGLWLERGWNGAQP